MPDTYEIQAPDGSTLEIQSDHPPTRTEALKAIRAYGDQQAAQAQARAQAQGSPLAAPSMENVGRFVGGVADVLNPLNLVKTSANLVLHPVDTLGQMASAQLEQGRQAVAKAQEPGLLSKVEAVGHGLAAVTPIVGPMAAQAGEQIAQGDVAGGLGRGIGLVAPVAAAEALRTQAANPARARLADMMERDAQQQVSQRVLAPGNPKFRGQAASIAPEILARKLSGGRTELMQAAAEGMDDAAMKIDAAIDSAGGKQAPVPVSSIVNKLKARVSDLQDSNGVPLSGQAAKRINALKERITQIQSLGRKQGTASFEDLRKIRDENYDLANQARIYEKAGNPVFSDQGWAAAETSSAVREAFAERSPAHAAANADYTFWKTLNDVLDPVIGRPKNMAPSQGVTGGARTVGAVTGQLFGGKAGAFIGSTVVPWVQEHLASPQWQLADAQSKIRLAEAMRRGDIGGMKAAMLRIEKGAAATSPSGSQTQPSSGAQAPSTP